jgi:hypothetical protein
MTNKLGLSRTIAALTFVLLAASGAGEVRADGTAAQACAAKLPKDARMIFGAALPQMAPGADLRDIVTAATRQLVSNGKIDRANARPSAVSAAQCLRLADG